MYYQKEKFLQDDFQDTDFQSDNLTQSEQILFSRGVHQYRTSVTGLDLSDGASALCDFAMGLEPFSLDSSPTLISSVPLRPVPGYTFSAFAREGQHGVNAAYAASMAYYFRSLDRHDMRPREVLMIGGRKGAVLNCVLFQKPVGMSVGITMLESPEFVEEARGTVLRNKNLLSLSGVSRIETDVFDLNDGLIPSPPGGGSWDIIILVSNVHCCTTSRLDQFVHMLRQDGVLLSVYPDARKASTLGDTPGFEFKGFTENGEAIVDVLGREYKDPPFDPPLYDLTKTVIHVGHQEFLLHKPWSDYVPRRMRQYCRGGLPRYFNVYMVINRPPQSMSVPITFDLSNLDETTSVPYERSIFMNNMDRAIGLTKGDLANYYTTSRWYYKEKYDGTPLMVVIGPNGIYGYSHENDAYFKLGDAPWHCNYYIVAQYEVVSLMAKLCSINGYFLMGEQLPYTFVDRHRGVLSWFSKTWHPLDELVLPIGGNVEGIVLCPAQSIAVKFKHYVNGDKSGNFAVVGVSRWVKQTPTMDIDRDGQTIEVNAYTGEFVRVRPGKKVNDSFRLATLLDLAPLEMVAAFAASNGTVGQPSTFVNDVTVSSYFPGHSRSPWTGAPIYQSGNLDEAESDKTNLVLSVLLNSIDIHVGDIYGYGDGTHCGGGDPDAFY